MNNVTSLASYSFSRGTIKRFEGYPQLEYIGYGSFEKCVYLADLNLAQTTITTIPKYCFKNSIINFLMLPSNIQIIESYAFHLCNVTSLFLPTSITDIQEGAFLEQAGNLRVFYFGMNQFAGRNIFSVKKGNDGVIKIFVSTAYPYKTLAGINVTISIDDMFVQTGTIRCSIPLCRCNSIHFVGIFLFFISH